MKIPEWVKKRKARRQFNFRCFPQLITILKLFAKDLELPEYLIAEHALETGLAAIARDQEDASLKERLRDHLVRRHLLTEVFDADDFDEAEKERATKLARDVIDREFEYYRERFELYVHDEVQNARSKFLKRTVGRQMPRKPVNKIIHEDP